MLCVFALLKQCHLFLVPVFEQVCEKVAHVRSNLGKFSVFHYLYSRGFTLDGPLLGVIFFVKKGTQTFFFFFWSQSYLFIMFVSIFSILFCDSIHHF